MTETPPAELPTPSRGLGRWAAFMVGWCVFLLLAGANVKTQRASLTVPDWPTVYGEWVPGWEQMKQLLGPDTLRAEFLHREIAKVMGLLTIVLVIWAWKREPRSWVRKLCYASLGLVIAQGIFGGLGVLTMLGPPWPLLHSTFAQVYLCLIVAIATFMSPFWRDAPDRELDAHSLPLMRYSILSIGALLVHLMLGAAARHDYLPREVHSMFALLVVIFIVKLTLTGAGDLPRDLTCLRRPAAFVGLMTVAQVGLGVASYLIASGRNERYILEVGQIAVLNLHLVVGASILAGCVVVLLRTVRVYGLPTDERVAEAVTRLGEAA